jgi:enoyl-CoA hydratase/carnithine racemase
VRERGETGNPDLDPDIVDVAETVADMTVRSAGSKGVAAGFELVLPVDVWLIDVAAKYGVTGLRLGAFPSGGSIHSTPRLAGLPKAKEIVLTGDLLDPAEAERIGPEHELVDDAADVDGRAREWADDLSTNAPLGMARARSPLEDAFDVPPRARTAARAQPWYGTRPHRRL